MITPADVLRLVRRISFNFFGNKTFRFRLAFDQVYKDPKKGGRMYLQVEYFNYCTKTGNGEWWKGRKWYLSEFMTRDEVVKTAYVAIKAVIEHEIMESFKVDDKIVFNPHTPYTELMKVSQKQVKRNDNTRRRNRKSKTKAC
jgi:hypothetical protein